MSFTSSGVVATLDALLLCVRPCIDVWYEYASSEAPACTVSSQRISLLRLYDDDIFVKQKALDLHAAVLHVAQEKRGV